MNTEEKNIEDYKYILDKQNEWIISADTKISIAFGVLSVVYSVLGYFSINNIINFEISDEKCIFIYILSVVLFSASIISFLISLFFYFRILYPNLDGSKIITKKNIKEKKVSIIYFDDISKFNGPDDYIEYVGSINCKDFEKQILEEVYYNGKICARKMRRFRKGLVYSSIGIILNILCCFFSLFL